MNSPRLSTVQIIDDLVRQWAQPPEILVVDDDEMVVKSLGDTLASLGLKVWSACTGEEAILAYRGQSEKRFQDSGVTGHPFDLIFLDMRLPGLSGMGVLKEIRAIWPTQPVVMISGNMMSCSGMTDFGPVAIDEKPITVQSVRIALAMHNIRMPINSRPL